MLPAAGPLTSDIAPRAAEPAVPRIDYVLLDVTDPMCRALAARPTESFRRAFGAGGPAPAATVGIGDSLSVTVWEAGPGGLFSSAAVNQVAAGSRTATIPEQVVARDGTNGVPYAGRLQVLGLRPADVEELVVQRLTGKAIEPQAIVTVTRTVSNSVAVSGEVPNGARIPLSVKGDRILDVIATAGGLRIPVSEALVRLTRGSRTVSVPYTRILNHPREDVYLRGGDVLTLERRPETFTAFGATGRNAQVPFEAEKVALDEAIAKAGGLLDHRADPTGVFLFRFENGDMVRRMAPDRVAGRAPGPVPVVYHLDLRQADSYFLARQFPVRDKDIIYVANAPFNELQKFLAMVGSVLGPAATTAAVGASVYSSAH